MRIGCPCLGTPVLEAKRRVGKHDVKPLECTLVGREAWRAECVLAQDLRVLQVVQVEVHPADGRGGQVDFLSVEAHLLS